MGSQYEEGPAWVGFLNDYQAIYHHSEGVRDDNKQQYFKFDTRSRKQVVFSYQDVSNWQEQRNMPLSDIV